MGRLADTFAELKERGAKALVTFITAGDPDLATTEELIPLMAEAGADIIELGVPFSDPMADGPTIQKASERALAAGTTLPGILDLVRRVRLRTQVPIILMGYYNPVFLYGGGRFVADAVAAGVDGVLLVDLPPEEAGEFNSLAEAAGLDIIFLLTPTADEGRIEKVASLGRGFVYYVSVTGVTGARTSVETTIGDMVGRIRARMSLPLVVGFGISTPAQAAEVAGVADGVVVGSALVKLFEQYGGEELQSCLVQAISSLKEGIGGV